MACPFCALGCRDGQPRTEEVTRNWRFLQLTAHPDQGGNTEAAAFLNTTKEYAIHYIKHLSTVKMGTISCRRHGSMSNEVPSPTYPIYQPHSTASASKDMFPPPPPPLQKRGQQLHQSSRPARTPGPLKLKHTQILPEGQHSSHRQSLPLHLHHQRARHNKGPLQHMAQITMTHSSPPLH